MSEIYIEVRCCCDGHLIGWLPDTGPIVKHLRREPIGVCESVQIPRPIETIILERKQFGGPFDTWPAYQSKDYPLEVLREIPGFYAAADGGPPFHIDVQRGPLI